MPDVSGIRPPQVPSTPSRAGHQTQTHGRSLSSIKSPARTPSNHQAPAQGQGQGEGQGQAQAQSHHRTASYAGMGSARQARPPTLPPFAFPFPRPTEQENVMSPGRDGGEMTFSAVRRQIAGGGVGGGQEGGRQVRMDVPPSPTPRSPRGDGSGGAPIDRHTISSALKTVGAEGWTPELNLARGTGHARMPSTGRNITGGHSASASVSAAPAAAGSSGSTGGSDGNNNGGTGRRGQRDPSRVGKSTRGASRTDGRHTISQIQDLFSATQSAGQDTVPPDASSGSNANSASQQTPIASGSGAGNEAEGGEIARLGEQSMREGQRDRFETGGTVVPHGSKRSAATMLNGDSTESQGAGDAGTRGLPKQRVDEDAAAPGSVSPMRTHQQQAADGSQDQNLMQLDNNPPSQVQTSTSTRQILPIPTNPPRFKISEEIIAEEEIKLRRMIIVATEGPLQREILARLSRKLKDTLATHPGEIPLPPPPKRSAHIASRDEGSGSGESLKDQTMSQEVPGMRPFSEKHVDSDRLPDAIARMAKMDKGKAPIRGSAVEGRMNGSAPARAAEDERPSNEREAGDGADETRLLDRTVTLRLPSQRTLYEGMTKMEAEKAIELIRETQARAKSNLPLVPAVDDKIKTFLIVLQHHCRPNAHPSVHSGELIVRLNQLLDPVARESEATYQFSSRADTRAKLIDQLRTHIIAKAEGRESLYFGCMTFELDVIQELSKAARDPNHLIFGRRDVIGPVMQSEGEDAGDIGMGIYANRELPKAMKVPVPAKKPKKGSIAPGIAGTVDRFDGEDESRAGPSRGGQA